MSKNTKHGRFPPFSLRLSFEERALIEQAAGRMPLGSYIRKVMLQEMTEKRKRRACRPIKDDVALAMLLAELGKSHLANNLNQLAKAANEGSLLITPETEQTIRDAYTEILWMRKTLLTALGFEMVD